MTSIIQRRRSWRMMSCEIRSKSAKIKKRIDVTTLPLSKLLLYWQLLQLSNLGSRSELVQLSRTVSIWRLWSSGKQSYARKLMIATRLSLPNASWSMNSWTKQSTWMKRRGTRTWCSWEVTHLECSVKLTVTSSWSSRVTSHVWRRRMARHRIHRMTQSVARSLKPDLTLLQRLRGRWKGTKRATQTSQTHSTLRKWNRCSSKRLS